MALLLLAVGVFWVLTATRPAPSQTPIAEVVRPVRTVTAQAVETSVFWEGYGTARSMFAADVAAQVTGSIVERPAGVEPGARIEAGDLIVAIDPSEFEARLSRTRQSVAALQADIESIDVEEATSRESLRLAGEALRLARWEADRLEELESQGAANVAEVNRQLREVARLEREQQELQQRVDLLPVRRQRITAQIDVERANARLAEIEVERTRVTAPFGGWLQMVNVQVGERVAPGTVVARLVDLRVIEIPLRIPLSAHGRVGVGDRVEILSNGGAGRSSGRIVRIAPEASAETRTLTVFAEVRQEPGAEDAIAPGQFVRARVVSNTPESRIAVPRSAVLGDRAMVVNGGGRAEPREVRVARYVEARLPQIEPVETQWAVIESGLAPGDRVIISNLDEVTPGGLVDAVDATSAAPARAVAPGSAGAAQTAPRGGASP